MARCEDECEEIYFSYFTYGACVKGLFNQRAKNDRAFCDSTCGVRCVFNISKHIQAYLSVYMNRLDFIFGRRLGSSAYLRRRSLLSSSLSPCAWPPVLPAFILVKPVNTANVFTTRLKELQPRISNYRPSLTIPTTIIDKFNFRYKSDNPRSEMDRNLPSFHTFKTSVGCVVATCSF